MVANLVADINIGANNTDDPIITKEESNEVQLIILDDQAQPLTAISKSPTPTNIEGAGGTPIIMNTESESTISMIENMKSPNLRSTPRKEIVNSEDNTSNLDPLNTQLNAPQVNEIYLYI